MTNTAVGFQWLKEKYDLSLYSLTHSSYIGNNDTIELTNKGNIEQIYGPKYTPKENLDVYHLEFGLKYDHFNLDLLYAVFKRISKEEITEFVKSAPSGKYARKIGFLYEWLTGNTIKLYKPINNNYVDLLESEDYIVGTTEKSMKWKINNNLLGSSQFCPVIRNSPRLKKLLETNIKEQIVNLKKDFPADVFKRAIRFLYTKETRSSYEIEREQPSPGRMERFIELMIKAGKEEGETMLEEKRLVELQNAIVDPRFAVKSFRDFQNYVGEMLGNFQDIIHYICPPPSMVPSLMAGLQQTYLKTQGATAPEIRAALLSFAFVFIHPFEDGNGRIHRFLIHDILAHDNIVPNEMIIPISAHMLNNIQEYDNILEKYSGPLMRRVEYNKTAEGGVTIINAGEIEGYYRYPDLTEQCIYLLETIRATLQQDMPDELTFLQRYEEAKRELQRIVDMPDREINWMLLFLHQNKGVFPKRRRDRFNKLTDEEIEQMQQAYKKVYEIN